ncbi:hypothetical protein O181_128211 [Austropuccinia psidii MF-1]|uniref:Uncharacterized protein n=1 Tax=Austropuccinia psidii MF-1 TaxID=1389203 RepID=A0A9Q3KXN2_9BASI|nr:hypothetical protein [Austropuccinia psidii MF-1]
MLTRLHCPPDETLTLPPHLHPHHSLRFHTPALTIVTLAGCPPDTTDPYACVVPSQHCLPSLCLKIPSQHAPNTTDLYACVVPSQHAPDTTDPYACVVPSQHAPDTTDPYACVVPSQHAPNTTYDPDARSALPTCSQHHLSLCL